MRYSLLMAGEKLMEVGQVFGKHYDSCFIVTLEHGICLHLVLQFGKLLVFESYQFSVSLYFFVHVDECYDYLQIMFLVLIASTLPILCVVILFHSCQWVLWLLSNYVLGTHCVNVANSFVVPRNVQGKFQPQLNILQYFLLLSLC